MPQIGLKRTNKFESLKPQESPTELVYTESMLSHPKGKHKTTYQVEPTGLHLLRPDFYL